jgi:HEAT repeat protein
MNRSILIIIGLLCAIVTAAGIMWYNNPLNTARRGIHDMKPLIRYYAVWKLYELNDKKSIPEIAKLLQDNSSGVREISVTVLKNFGAKEAAPKLSLADGWIRAASIIIVESGPLKGFLDNPPDLHEYEPEERTLAVQELDNLGAKDIIPQIIKLLKDDYPTARASAALALNTFGVKEAIPEIKKLLKDETKLVRDAAEKSLKQLRVSEEEIERAKNK